MPLNSNVDYDVVVQGAGPSGSLAAYYLANAGLSVLLIDRAVFPRVKPCGGGITVKALAMLPFSVQESIQASTCNLNIGLRNSAPTTLMGANPICGFVVRSKFDAILLQNACSEGAEFANDSIETFTEYSSEVRMLLGSGRTIRSSYLIGADGANSKIRRILYSQDNEFKIDRGFAIEAIVSKSNVSAMPSMEFDFGYIPYGYGWLFPKGDHVNAGIYTSVSNVKLSRKRLLDYIQLKLGTDKVEEIYGFPLVFGGHKWKTGPRRTILVGDAAGYIEPLLGEGIHNALKSGRAVAKSIIEEVGAECLPIDKSSISEIREIDADMRRCHKFAHFYFYPNVVLGYYALRFPLVRLSLMRGYSAGKTFRQITNFPMGCHVWKPKYLASADLWSPMDPKYKYSTT